ncbi:MAG TPA: hypothetical protein VEF36_14015, partial [Roseiarcus sp.]|nr:hypothetical protein [Roseiarcus sp.]
DRIDTKGGYTKSNVRIVCFAVNVMLMDWGTQVLDRVLSHYRAHKRTKLKRSIPTARGPVGNGDEKINKINATS